MVSVWRAMIRAHLVGYQPVRACSMLWACWFGPYKWRIPSGLRRKRAQRLASERSPLLPGPHQSATGHRIHSAASRYQPLHRCVCHRVLGLGRQHQRQQRLIPAGGRVGRWVGATLTAHRVHRRIPRRPHSDDGIVGRSPARRRREGGGCGDAIGAGPLWRAAGGGRARTAATAAGASRRGRCDSGGRTTGRPAGGWRGAGGTSPAAGASA